MCYDSNLYDNKKCGLIVTLIMKKRIILLLIATLYISAALTGCRHRTGVWNSMNEAERLIRIHPDSSLSILSAIDRHTLGDDEEKARYALLMSMALDKNYIDTTTFEILQPAIDYYLKKGTPDEKLRTLYYQACIYRNRGDDGNAMTSCMEALELKDVTDTLVMAQLLVGQGVLYDKQYKISEFAENNLIAAKLYHSAGKHILAIKSYAKALDGAVILGMEDRADSLVEICTALVSDYPEMEEFVNNYYLSYLIKYGTNEELLRILKKHEYYDLPESIKLNMVRGYAKSGEIGRALSLFETIEPGTEMADSIKYYAIKSEVLEMVGDVAGALDAYKKYMSVAERFHVKMFSNDLLFAGKKHRLEISNLIEVHKRDRIIRYCLFAIIGLFIISGIVVLRYYKGRTKRVMAELDNIRLKLEKQAAELKLENLRLEKSELESERDNLKELLIKQKGLGEPIQNIIRQRLNLLNSLLAKEISNNDVHAIPYKQWIEHIRKDKEDFLNSTRMALTASHPAFMNYLATRGLTDDEIKYVCLYAIGLKGKEIGAYLQLKNYYNVSSTIRKKFGATWHDTNIGLYIRRLMYKLG